MNLEQIRDYIENNFSFESLEINTKSNIDEIKRHYVNSKVDAIYCYEFIKSFLTKDKKILEVGGGIHLLTSYLNNNYDVTSIEPGGYKSFTNELRNKILSKKNLKVHTTALENFKTDEKFDLIFSMNVLEHTDDIEIHLRSCINLLRDEKSLLLIQCPNYTFPYECHFYKWFIPFMPNFTFKYFSKKTLIKQIGEDKYNSIFNSLNFNCTYFKIKNLKLPIVFHHPLKLIFDRMEKDKIFKDRLCQNPIINACYKLINLFKIKGLLIFIYPKFLCPYLIMEIKK